MVAPGYVASAAALTLLATMLREPLPAGSSSGRPARTQRVVHRPDRTPAGARASPIRSGARMHRVTSTPTKEPTRRRAWSGLVLVCSAGVVWGTIGPAVDVVHQRSSLSVLTIGAYRAVAAVAVLALAATAAHRWPACRALVRAHGRRVALVGALTAVFQLLFFVAVVATGVSVTTVVALGFAPVLLLIVASVRDRRPRSTAETLTVGTALLGLLLVSTGGGGDVHAPHPAWGVLAALGSGAAYALSAEVGGSLTQEHDALAVTTCTMSVVAAVLVPGGLGLALLRGGSVGASDVGAWVLVVYLGVVTMAFAYVLLYAGLRTTPSGTAVVATLLEPVTAVLIAVLFLGETLSVAGVLGSLLILGAISSLGRRVQQPQAQ
jgi:drug/metabolite transporter, DME family